MFVKAKEPTVLDKQIAKAEAQLDHYVIGDDEYMQALEIISKLRKMREEDKTPRPSPDTIAIVASNLIGIILIIRHENVNVIASRAMGMVLKPRQP